MRLSTSTLQRLDRRVRRLLYDRSAPVRGAVVHFGLGAFHRAHQAVYTDDAAAEGEGVWAITGVSLRSTEVRAQLVPQDGLCTVAERSVAGTSVRVIGAIREVLVAPESPLAVIDALASPQTHVASFTITEKGYWRRPDGGLDVEAADVAHDLRGEGAPRTIYGFLTRALKQRRDRGLSGLSLVSCDNLAGNGALLEALLGSFIERVDARLAAWIRAHCACPSTMVDRIVPATTPADRDAVAGLIGLRDEAAVVTEPFRQWVIEDRFAGPRPRWEAGGAQLVTDVAAHETAKLRMLNGAHSALAYLGLRRGHAYVHEAIADVWIRPVVERLMRVEAAASFDLPDGFDAGAYTETLLARFANSALPHRLAQIAADGSQKIPYRWLKALAVNRGAGRDCPATLQALAAWLLHVRGDSSTVDDPMAGRLAQLWRESGSAGIASALFAEGGLLAATWAASAEDRATLTRRMGALEP